MKHTISVLVENRFGVLARIAGLFSGRGFNIESISAATTQDRKLSRMTIVTEGSPDILEQITKQLNRLIDVIKVIDLSQENYVDRELCLVKVSADPSVRADVMRATDIFRGKIVDVTQQTYTVEITGDEEKIEAFLDLMATYGIREVVRTGKVAMVRGQKTIRSRQN